MTSSKARALGSWLTALVFLTASVCAQATVLVTLSFDDLVKQSVLIFQGRVTGHEVAARGELVYTMVSFDVEDVLKGSLPDSTLSLGFVGGTIGQVKVEISGQYIPAVGDHGLYFVSKDGAGKINPLTGWYQGAFLIDDSGPSGGLLDLSQRRDLILSNTFADPLARKMVGLGFTEEQITAKLPEYSRFPLDDFKAAIRNMVNPGAR